MTIGIDKQWFVDRWTEKGLSLRKVATMIGMDPAALSRALDGKRGIKVEDIGKIATAMDVSRSEILAHLGEEEGREAAIEGKSAVVHRRDGFGFMKGLLTIEDGYDLTRPSDEDWEGGRSGMGSKDA